MRKYIILISFLLCQGLINAAGIMVGTGRVVITPELPMWLTGYASREQPAKGVIHDLWAKALVLEENDKNRVIIVTTDLLGLSHEITEEVAKAVYSKYGIQRSQLLLNSSHTHSGPMIWPCLDVIYDFDQANQQIVSAYGKRLIGDLIRVIDMAMRTRSRAQLAVGHGTAGFAINRRLKINNRGPVDHDVPVLKISTPEGKLRAVLFGYACHNTTIVDDNYLFNGDYAGFAQIEIEKNNPGVLALFLMGCGGDQNPAPRGTIALAQKHGETLAAAVEEVLSRQMRLIHPTLRTAYAVTNLKFQSFDLGSYQKDIIGNNKFLQRRAKLMLEAYNKGWPIDHMPYPMQVVRLGDGFTILALSGEVVVDYALRAKKLYPQENLFVAGYTSEVMCYIPSKRLLKEGGYEPDESMIYYGHPGPFAGDVEERIFIAIKHLMKQAGAVSSNK